MREDDLVAFERQLKIDIIADHYNPIVEWFMKLWNSLAHCPINIYDKDDVVGTIYYTKDTKQWFFYIGDATDEFDADIIYCNEYTYYRFMQQRLQISEELSCIATKILLGNVFGKEVPYAISNNTGLIIGDLESLLV